MRVGSCPDARPATASASASTVAIDERILTTPPPEVAFFSNCLSVGRVPTSHVANNGNGARPPLLKKPTSKSQKPDQNAVPVPPSEHAPPARGPKPTSDSCSKRSGTRAIVGGGTDDVKKSSALGPIKANGRVRHGVGARPLFTSGDF